MTFLHKVNIDILLPLYGNYMYLKLKLTGALNAG